MSKFFQDHVSSIRAFVDLSSSIGSRPDFVQGGGGNTSVKLDGSLMAVKASGFRLADIREDNAYAVLDYAALRRFYLEMDPTSFSDVEKEGAACVKASVRPVEGIESLRPSVEAGFHSLLDAYVAHTHAVYANLATCAAECDEIVSSALKNADYAFGIVPYVDPGARLTFAMRDEMRRVKAECGRVPSVFFLKNHGIVAHDVDPVGCLRIHEDANRRIAAVFGVEFGTFPHFSLREVQDGLLEADCPYLSKRIACGEYNEGFFLEHPLYPDQIVFLVGIFSFGDGIPEEGHCLANPTTGRISLRMSESRARVVLEMLVSVVFVAEGIRRKGATLVPMGVAAKNFIAGWESEKYRRSVSEQRSK